jgi:hypothetical protein
LSPLPLNANQNITVNGRLNISEQISSEVEIHLKIRKLLFGSSWLPIPIPCVYEFFGSCNFKLCDGIKKHPEPQVCNFILKYYKMKRRCPDILIGGVGFFQMKNFHYVPQVKKILHYMSWIAMVFIFLLFFYSKYL